MLRSEPTAIPTDLELSRIDPADTESFDFTATLPAPVAQIRAGAPETTALVTLEQIFLCAEITVFARSAGNSPQQPAERSVTLRIPKGATQGDRIHVRGASGKRGVDDVYVTLKVAKHRLFRILGHDLYLRLPIAPWEAALGAVVDVPTLYGSTQVTIKPDAGLQRLRIPGRGLPKPGGAAGDLFLLPRIVMPEASSSRERALYRSLAKGSTFDPRASLRAV